jgi:hypothetical protein
MRIDKTTLWVACVAFFISGTVFQIEGCMIVGAVLGGIALAVRGE